MMKSLAAAASLSVQPGQSIGWLALLVWLAGTGQLALAQPDPSPATAATDDAPVASADQDVYRWPQFRGGAHDAKAAAGARLPIRWSESENIRWKLPTELRGWSSPAVWGDTAVLTEATEDGREMFALAVDLDNGTVRWRKRIFTNDQVEESHQTNSYASPSPATDGRRAWVHFGSYGTACLDLASGEVIWQRRDLPCSHYRGPGSSPLLDDEGRLFIHLDGFDLQYIVALSADSGETLWKRDRDVDYGTTNGDQMKAFSTPKLIDVDGQRQLISPTSKATIAYRPETGEEIWRVRYTQFSATAQPLFDGQRVYISTGFGKSHLIAVDPRGTGDITDTQLLWETTRGIGSKPTPLLHDGLIYNVHDAGVATCLEAASGETLWTQRFGGEFSASPLGGDGVVYWFDHDGTCYVTRQGREFELVAENRLDDGCMASPVPLPDSLLIRTRSALYRIDAP